MSTCRSPTCVLGSRCFTTWWSASALSRKRPARRSAQPRRPRLLLLAVIPLVIAVTAIASALLLLGDDSTPNDVLVATPDGIEIDISCCPQAGEDVRALVGRYSPVLFLANDDFDP